VGWSTSRRRSSITSTSRRVAAVAIDGSILAVCALVVGAQVVAVGLPFSEWDQWSVSC
jgi:hypothetical protein